MPLVARLIIFAHVQAIGWGAGYVGASMIWPHHHTTSPEVTFTIGPGDGRMMFAPSGPGEVTYDMGRGALHARCGRWNERTLCIWDWGRI